MDDSDYFQSCRSADQVCVSKLNNNGFLSLQGSINSDKNSMFGNSSYYSEGDISITASIESTTNSYPTSQTPVHVYGAIALSPTGSESRVLLSDFDAFPVNTTCDRCRQDVTTHIRYRRGKLTYLSSILMAVLCCGLGCFLIPCCVKSFKDVFHECPNCGTTLGVYKRKASCVS